MTGAPLESLGGTDILASMSTPHLLWNAVNAHLKATGTPLKLRVLDDFQAWIKFNDKEGTLYAEYQPREGRIAGTIRLHLHIEGNAARRAIGNFLCAEEHYVEKVKQKFVFKYDLNPTLPTSLAEASLKIEARIVSWHTASLVKRLSPWVAESTLALLWLQTEMSKERP